MLPASDDERYDDEGFTHSHAKGSATSKRKGHEQISVHELVQRDCRCQRKVCFRQFCGHEKSLTVKRSEFASLDPSDRVACLSFFAEHPIQNAL